MVDYTVNDIVGLSASQQPLKVADAFDSIMRQRLSDRLADFQDQFSQSVFSTTAEEDLEDEDFDIDTDEADDNDGDSDDEFELLDLDDDDLDLEDLEDLDLDLEDDSDEDA